MERAIRVSRTRQRETSHRHSRHSVDHILLLSQFPAPFRHTHRHALAPLRTCGGSWLMDYMQFNQSVATVVGFIALAGVAAETGVVMLIYLQNAWQERKAEAATAGRALSKRDLHAAIMEGAVERVRPKMMTVAAIMAGLVSDHVERRHGIGDYQRIAVPMIGGMATLHRPDMVVIPVLFALVRARELSVGNTAANCSKPSRGKPWELLNSIAVPIQWSNFALAVHRVVKHSNTRSVIQNFALVKQRDELTILEPLQNSNCIPADLLLARWR